EQVDHRLKSLLPVEEDQTGPATGASHVRVDETITELLINAGSARVAECVRHQLREQFPVREMTQHHHQRHPLTQLSIYRIEVFDRDAFQDLLQRHGGDL